MISTNLSLAYCTNIWNHYQAPFCKELAHLWGESHFKVCLFEPVDEERRQLGWPTDISNHEWLAGPPRSGGDMAQLSKIVCDADVAILGACPEDVKVARASTGKLTFIMGERICKKPFHGWRLLNPRFACGVKRFKNIANRENVHYLAIGAYASGDVYQIGAFGNRLWTWAYFPEITSQPPQQRTAESIQILWAGRMLNWKRVDILLKAVALVCHQPNFGRVDIVGTGPEKSRLLKLAQTLNMGRKCVFHEPVSPDRVRELMRQAHVYALPSNRHEGWGVVANEAMSEGAVLVANEQAGAATVLIDNGRTGFLFSDGDSEALASILQTLMTNATLQDTIRLAAWQNMQQTWHPNIGAERLVGLCQGLLGIAPMPNYREGPCCRVTGA